MKKRIIVFVVLLVYIAIIVKVLVFKNGINFNSHGAINVEPFYTIKNYTLAMKNSNISVKDYLYNIIGNIIIFIPFGIVLPYIMFGMKRLNTLFVGFLFVLLIEGVQFIASLGVFDIDDIILNVTGVMIGIIIYSLAIRIRGDNGYFKN